MFLKEKEICFKEKNIAYDFMFLVPPSLVNRQEGFLLLDDYQKNGFEIWDGTKKDIRSEYPSDEEQHRLLQYDSCRGLEAWTVVCIGIDDLVNYKVKTYVETQESFFLQDTIRNKNKFVYLWSLIPLTRPMDTLIITLKNPKSDYSIKLKNFSKKYTEIVTWIN